jgi:hypothetical protein
MQYAGMAFSLLAYILVGYGIAKLIIAKFSWDEPLTYASCITIALLIGLYQIISEILRNSHKK